MDVYRSRRLKLILKEGDGIERKLSSTMLVSEGKDRLVFSSNVVGDGDISHWRSF